MMFARILLALFVLGCAAQSVVAGAAAVRVKHAASITAHLYVGGGKNPAFRYPVANGVPAPQPDLQYPVLSAPFATDANGDFYATVVSRTLGFAEYPPNSNRASRSVLVPIQGDPYIINASGLAVDSAGNAYISFSYVYSIRRDIPADGPLTECFTQGYCTLAYSTSAHGFATPIAGLPSDVSMIAQLAVIEPGVVYGLSVGSNGKCDWPIDVIKNFMGRPRRAAAICSDPIKSPVDIKIDPSGQIYVMDQPLGSVASSLVVFAPGFSNGGTPLRTLKAPPITWTGPFAVDSRYLYVAGGPGVLIYDRTAHGMAKPIATLTLAHIPEGIAVGP